MPGARLTLEEREVISRGLVAEKSFCEIARELGRPASTVSREVDRYGGRKIYRAAWAQRTSGLRARRTRPSELVRYPELAREVERRIRMFPAPNQRPYRMRPDRSRAGRGVGAGVLEDKSDEIRSGGRWAQNGISLGCSASGSTVNSIASVSVPVWLVPGITPWTFVSSTFVPSWSGEEPSRKTATRSAPSAVPG